MYDINMNGAATNGVQSVFTSQPDIGNPPTATSTSHNHTTTLYASHACTTCRKQKRRCTKELPSCRLCARLYKSCDYSEMIASTAELQQRINELEARLEQQNNDSDVAPSTPTNSSISIFEKQSTMSNQTRTTSPAFFLDYEAFQQSRLSILSPNASIPSEINMLLGDMNDIITTTTQFFNTIHNWLPMISKKRLDLTLTSPCVEIKPDLAIMILAMKLIIQPHHAFVGKTAQTSTYWTLKHFFTFFESSGRLSIPLLQTGILIAAYEIGHALYPAAYLTPASCARLGQALGIDNRRVAPQMISKRFGSWAENEEVRRTWWAVMILDRYVNVSFEGHVLATDDPFRQDVLPACDDMWDMGEMVSVEPIYVASPTNVPAGPYARTCQAANLMGRVIRHCNDRSEEAVPRFEEAVQLHKTVVAFSKLLPADDYYQQQRQQQQQQQQHQQHHSHVHVCDHDQSILHYGTAVSLTYSTLLHIYDPYACTDRNGGANTVVETEMQTIAIAGLKSTANDVVTFSQKICASMATNMDATSPLVTECMYQAAATYAWLVHESGSREVAAQYHALRDILNVMNERWGVAGEYVRILDQTKETLFDNNPLL